MNKKRWTLVVLIAIAVFGYIRLFYKTYSTAVVTGSADYIIAADVKRITNTIIWNTITTPSQWKKVSFSSGNKEDVSWKDMVKIPDYIFAFHVKDQPLNTWYLVLQVKDEKDFAKGLQVYHFEKLDSNSYASKDYPFSFFKSGDKILITNTTSANNSNLSKVANELFVQKKYIPKQTLEKVIDAKSHLAIYLPANNFLQEAAVVSGNFDKTKIEISCTITPKEQFAFIENNFTYSDTSLLSLSFIQPSNSVLGLLSNADKDNISKALNLNIDSFFLPNNKDYRLDLSAIKTRIDSAISYTYDEDFNKVEKAVVNTVQEPAFNFTITSDSVNEIYGHWQRSNKLETTEAGELFTVMPFVKSYCNKKSAAELTVTSNNYEVVAADKNIAAVLFFKLMLTKIPKDLLRYLPDDVSKTIANLESVQLTVNRESKQLHIECVLKKQQNEFPIIKF